MKVAPEYKTIASKFQCMYVQYIFVACVTVRTKICLNSERGIGHTQSTKQAAMRARGMPRHSKKKDAWIQWMAKDCTYIRAYIHAYILYSKFKCVSSSASGTHIRHSAVRWRGQTHPDDRVLCFCIRPQQQAGQTLELEAYTYIHTYIHTVHYKIHTYTYSLHVFI